VQYELEFDDEVESYLSSREGMTEANWAHVYARFDDLRRDADHYRTDQSRRLAPGSTCFWFRIVFPTPVGIRHFRFAVDDESATYGVLRIVFTDEVPW